MSRPDMAIACFDINGTLANTAGMSHMAAIEAVTPLDADEARRVLEEEFGLNTIPDVEAFTPEVVVRVCEELRIAGSNWPFGVVPMVPYELKSDAVDAVRTVSRHVPVVTLSNTSAFALHDKVHDRIERQLGDHVSAAYHSCRIGASKPDPQVFRHVIHAHGIAAEQFVHIGNCWRRDIEPVLALGGYAAWVNPQGLRVPLLPPEQWERLIVASSAADAACSVVRRWMAPAHAPSAQFIRPLAEAGDALRRTVMLVLPKPSVVSGDAARWDGEAWSVEWRRDVVTSMWDTETDAYGFALALLAAEQRRQTWIPASDRGSRPLTS